MVLSYLFNFYGQESNEYHLVKHFLFFNSKDDERVKMKEEAKKRRAQIARAAKLPHVQRNESKVSLTGLSSATGDIYYVHIFPPVFISKPIAKFPWFKIIEDASQILPEMSNGKRNHLPLSILVSNML